jgi:hypothetical protein
MNPIFFTSQRNYMKRDPSSGSTPLAGPSTPAYSGYLYETNYTVTHNLGFIPLVRTYYEPFGDGVIWPGYMGTRLTTDVPNPRNTSANGPGMIAWPTTTTLQIQLFYFNNSLAGNSYPVYWVIYKDYQL